jgi:hypothetical protein
MTKNKLVKKITKENCKEVHADLYYQDKAICPVCGKPTTELGTKDEVEERKKRGLYPFWYDKRISYQGYMR